LPQGGSLVERVALRPVQRRVQRCNGGLRAVGERVG
jgi:hypothetical protein